MRLIRAFQTQIAIVLLAIALLAPSGRGYTALGADDPLPDIAAPPGDVGVESLQVVDAFNANANWLYHTVDAENDRGRQSSIAVGPNGEMFISYYDETNFTLRVAQYVRNGGNCGPDNSWRCEIVDDNHQTTALRPEGQHR
jgi:hypothetical protein